MRSDTKLKAEALFAERFMKNMKEGHIKLFKIRFRTVYNKVIIPLLVEQMEKNTDGENKELK